MRELKPLFRKTASKGRVRAATEPRVISQLRLYGIPFRTVDTTAASKAVLETAVRAGKILKPYPFFRYGPRPDQAVCWTILLATCSG